MEKSSTSFKDILGLLASGSYLKHSLAFDKLFAMSSQKRFVDDLVAAISADPHRNTIVDALLDLLGQRTPCREIWLALAQVCGPRQLARLVPYVGEMSLLTGTDATQVLKKAVRNMRLADQPGAIICLAEAEPDDAANWGTCLFELSRAQTQATLALLNLACRVGHLLSTQQ